MFAVAGDGDGLAIPKLNGGAGAALGDGGGNQRGGGALRNHPNRIGVAELTHQHIKVEIDAAGIQHGGHKLHPDTKLFVLNGGAIPVWYRNGEFPAGQKTGLLSALGDQARFRQDACQTFILEETQGIIVYQEQVMQAGQILAPFYDGFRISPAAAFMSARPWTCGRRAFITAPMSRMLSAPVS